MSTVLLQSPRNDVVSRPSQRRHGQAGLGMVSAALEALGWTTAEVSAVALRDALHDPAGHDGALLLGALQAWTVQGHPEGFGTVLAGSLNHPHQADGVARWLRTRLAEWRELRVVIHPVVGGHDHGSPVDPAMAEAYRREVLPLAEGVTSNGVELAHLTGLPVNHVASVVAAARTLLTGRTRWVVVTNAAPDTRARDEMLVVVVTPLQAEVIVHPRIDAPFTGCGELFCATLTGHWLKGAELSEAATRACRQVMRALRHTQRMQSSDLLLPQADSDNDAGSGAREFISKFFYRIFPCSERCPI